MSKIQNIIRKLNAYFEEGQFYEAEQLYKTLYTRYSDKGRHAQALALVLHGARRLFEHGQVCARAVCVYIDYAHVYLYLYVYGYLDVCWYVWYVWYSYLYAG